jgi:hypothetical protein
MIKTIVKKTYVNDEGFNFTFEPLERSLTIKKTKTGFEARYLTPDNDPIDPREDENYSNMVCFSNRYTLGDKHNYSSYEDFVLSFAEELGIIASKDNDGNYTIRELFEEIKKRLVCILPLYLYDHSGISMRTFKFGQHKDWDCGQVGFIYLTKEGLEKWGIKKSQVEKALMQEVEIYSQYLEGDVYCIVKENYDKNKKQLDYDVCGGYFGYTEALKSLETDI